MLLREAGCGARFIEICLIELRAVNAEQWGNSFWIGYYRSAMPRRGKKKTRPNLREKDPTIRELVIKTLFVYGSSIIYVRLVRRRTK